jgi:plasmid stability protein
LDDQTVARLKVIAKANGRSLEAEMRAMAIERAATHDRRAAHEEILRIRAAVKKSGSRRKVPDSTEMVRELRERWNR